MFRLRSLPSSTQAVSLEPLTPIGTPQGHGRKDLSGHMGGPCAARHVSLANQWDSCSFKFMGIRVTTHSVHVRYSSWDMSVRTAKCICAYVCLGLMLLTCGTVTTGVSLLWTAGVTGALPGGSIHSHRELGYSNLAVSAHISAGHMLQSHSSTTAPDTGTYQVDGDLRKLLQS